MKNLFILFKVVLRPEIFTHRREHNQDPLLFFVTNREPLLYRLSWVDNTKLREFILACQVSSPGSSVELCIWNDFF
jgi:hypothetical protein